MRRKDDSHDLVPAGRGTQHAGGQPRARRPAVVTELGSANRAPDMFLDAEPESGRSITDYLDILYRRSWIILLVFGLIFAGGVAYNWSVTPVYRSNATIEIQRINWRPRQALGTPEHVDFMGYFSTQLQILKSRGMAQDFIEHSELLQSPEVILKGSTGPNVLEKLSSALVSWLPGAPHREGYGQAETDLKSRLITALVKKMDAKRVQDTDLAEVTMEMSDPVVAQGLLGQYLDLYLQRNLEKRRNDHLKASAWLKEELEKVKKKLMTSEAELLEFITEHGIVSKDGGFGEVMGLVNKSLERVRQSQEARIRIEALQNQNGSAGSGGLPRGVGGQFVGSLKQQLASMESEYTELSGVYSPSSPKMTMLRKKIEYLRKKIEETEASVVNNALDHAKSEEKLLKEALDEAKKEAARINSLEAKLAILKKEVDADRQFYNMLLKEYKEMDIRAGTLFNNITIVDPPRKPVVPVKPRTLFNLLVAALLGLAGGIIAAFVVESMDTTIRSPKDIDGDIGVKRLGIVPDLSRDAALVGTTNGASSYEFIAFSEPRSAMSDAIKNIQTSIFLAHPTDEVHSMIVSSATPSEGKTLISVSIATILSSGSNKKTLLVDADLRRPRVHKIFGRHSPGLGLSTLLTGQNVKLKDVIQNHTRIPRFFYMTSGPVPDDPVSLLKSERMHHLVRYLGNVFDYIVFDSPPVLGFADAQILCRYTDGMIMVAKQGHVGREELREAMNSIASIHGGRVLGVVLNKAHPRRGGYGYAGYYYSRKYRHYYHYRASGDA